jgi:hypothetical protein
MLVNDETLAEHPSHVPNGLTASAPGAAVIRTGIHTGVVDVTCNSPTRRPPPRRRDGTKWRRWS